MRNYLFYFFLCLFPIWGFGQILEEGFDDITTLSGAGWTMTNQSDSPGSTEWFQGSDLTFPGYSGGATSYIAANYNNASSGTISNWLITPVVNVKDGDVLSFYTRTSDPYSGYDDRLEIRMSTGTMTVPSTGSTDTGSFSTVIDIINDNYDDNYPHTWTLYQYTVSGVGSTPVMANFAFRYNVTNAGLTGTQSDYIGIDSVLITEDGGTGGDFPAPYCEVSSYSYVEPISRVVFADIDNPSSPSLDESEVSFHEDFTSIVGNVQVGETYDFAAEGNTGGTSYTNSFTVFIDWNQDFSFNNDDERYEIGTITGSDGTDGQQAVNTIIVPDGAIEGQTRMRIIKKYLEGFAPDGCTSGSSFGQAEDYTLNVTGGTGGGDELLVVDLTTENQVTITATTNPSAGTVSGSTTSGFYLENIFANTGTQAIGTAEYVGTPTLTAASVPTDNSPNLYRSGSSDPGLNIWSYSATTPTTFTTGEQAFTGEATWSISADLYNALLTAPESGNVYFPADDVTDLGTATLLGTYTLILPDGPPPTGDDCEQGDDSNAFENGHQIGSGTDYENADDFYVSAGNTLNVQTIELNAIAMAGPVDSIGFTFYEDDGGAPGSTVVATIPQTVPYDQVLIGNAFGYDVYAIYVDVDVSFEGGTSGTSYWMQPTAIAPGGEIGAVFWEITSVGTLGEVSHTRTAGGPWEADPDGYNTVFKLHCEHVDPPIPPCTFSITNDVEPITRVVVADIDNPSDATVNGSPALEDFTAVEGHVAAGESYDVALEGNTAGNFTTYFTIFVDWNQDGDMTDDGEMYEIGSITNSTGIDGQQATGNITVPADATEGATMMRVIKNYNASPTNPCGTYGWGQAEDYTIVVGDVPPPGGDCGHSTPSNNFENGHGNLHLLVVANDFPVEENTMFTADQVKFNVILPAGMTVDAADVYFYEDTNGAGPGAQIGNTQEFIIPTEVNFLGNLSAYDVNEVVLDIDPTEFSGTSTGATYWLGIMIYTDATASYWEGTSILNTANEGYLYDDTEGTWGSISSTFDSDPFDGVFEITGQCEQLGVSNMNSFDFAYYPNPVKDVLNITSSKAIENVSAYNLAGQSVLNNAKVTNGQINVSALPTGVYVFRVTLQGGQIETFKIVKK